jgi:hypothetical protein
MSNPNEVHRNIDELNHRLGTFNLPTHRKEVTESHANLDWLKKNVSKKNSVDSEVLRLLHLNPKELHCQYIKQC